MMIELPSKTLAALVEAAARTYGSKPALVVYDKSLSYEELYQRARRTASALLGDGLEPGDHVALWLPNDFAFTELTFACAMAGLVIVPLNTRLRSSDAADALAKSRAKALFFTESFLGVDYLAMVETLVSSGQLPQLRRVVNVGSLERGSLVCLQRWLDAAHPAPLPEVDENAPAALNFTSGTTSSPKAAVLSNRSVVHIAREVAVRMEISPSDRMASAMPFYHNGGLIPTLLSCMMAGCTLYTQPKFDADYTLETIGRERCTIAGGVGTMFVMMLDSPKLASTDLTSIRAARVTGPADMRRRIWEAFGHPMLFSLYGMTESTAAVTLTCPGDSMDEQLNTNGKPLPGTAIRIVDAQGAPVAQAVHGLIEIGGESVMQGYYADAAATAAVLTDDGWIRSGDIGYMDGRGNVVLVGRQKDMYRSGGENVACAEVEEFLRGHPAVLHAAVLGVPDPRLDEVGFAYIEPRSGHDVQPADLQAYCRANLANFKVPRYVQIRKGLPLTVSGRVEKHKLKDEACLVAKQMAAGSHKA